MCVYIYICLYVNVYIYIYIYTYVCQASLISSERLCGGPTEYPAYGASGPHIAKV